MAMKTKGIQPERMPVPSMRAEEANTLIDPDKGKYLDGLLEASTMAKKTSPYGPQFPMLANYFKAK